MSCGACGRVYVSEAKGGEDGLELIFIAVAAVAVELWIFRVFEKRCEKRWESCRTRNNSESFWQNIISYDQEKGGEKE